ncbi:MAG TPA: mobile mystery protein B, partial [Gammaproteobacteria bacterium]|nr:mobile mystery protein B [Gammaproteobacteria bacterium]
MTSIIEDPDGATPLDPDELEGLKFKHITTRGQLNEVEQINVQNGLMWLRRKRKTQILSEEFARELHRRLFGEIWRWAGEFRQTEKSIGIDPIYIGVQIKVVLDDAAYWAEHGTFSP